MNLRAYVAFSLHAARGKGSTLDQEGDMTSSITSVRTINCDRFTTTLRSALEWVNH